MRVYGDDVMGTLEVGSNFFKRHRTAVGGDRTCHSVVFALFLVFSSGQSSEKLRTAAPVNKENCIIKILVKMTYCEIIIFVKDLNIGWRRKLN